MAIPPRGLEGDRERAVDPAAPERVEDDLALAVLSLRIADVFGDETVAVRQPTRRRLLSLEMAQQALCGTGLQPVVGLQEMAEPSVVKPRLGGLQEEPDPFRDLEPAVALVGAPERRHRRPRPRRQHEHVVMRDPLDPPRLNPEGEGIAHRAFPDELLVQLAEQRGGVGDAEVEVPAIGYCAAREVDDPVGPGPGAYGVVHAVDRNQRLELADSRLGVPAREHLQHEVEQAARQVVVRVAPSQGGVEVFDAPRLPGGHRDDLLRQHVERTLNRSHRLDPPLKHRACHHRGPEQILRDQRKERSLAGFADGVPGPADALYRRRDARRRLHQDDLVERPDVDPQLERVGGHDPPQLAGLEPLLHLRSDLAR